MSKGACYINVPTFALVVRSAHATKCITSNFKHASAWISAVILNIITYYKYYLLLLTTYIAKLNEEPWIVKLCALWVVFISISTLDITEHTLKIIIYSITPLSANCHMFLPLIPCIRLTVPILVFLCSSRANATELIKSFYFHFILFRCYFLSSFFLFRHKIHILSE